jgi:hypothetical protein
MRRVIVSFALANLSLLSAYVIAATWPDQVAPGRNAVASVDLVTPAVAPKREIGKVATAEPLAGTAAGIAAGLAGY